MRKTHRFPPAPRKAAPVVIAALAACAIAIPAISFAQDRGPHAPAMGSGQGMQHGTQGMPGSGPHMAADQTGESPHMSRQVERFMMLYDLNHDGKVTIEEINNDQARIFAAMDIDGDKSMSVDEIRRRGRSLQIFRTTTLFDLLDANGDGKLSLEEIQAPSQRWFKRYDKNGDGVMDASEVPERSWQRGRGGHGRR